MPAISLGFGEVEERLQQIRRRLNSLSLQHVAYLNGTLIVLLGALLVMVSLRAPPPVVRSCITAYVLASCAIAGLAAFRLRARWLSLEGVARLADRAGALDSRLSTLCAHQTSNRRSRLRGLLLAQTLALSPRWDRSALAPRRVPRSIYLLLGSLALLLGTSWFVPAPQAESAAAADDTSASAHQEEPSTFEQSSDGSAARMASSHHGGAGAEGDTVAGKQHGGGGVGSIRGEGTSLAGRRNDLAELGSSLERRERNREAAGDGLAKGDAGLQKEALGENRDAGRDEGRRATEPQGESRREGQDRHPSSHSAPATGQNTAQSDRPKMNPDVKRQDTNGQVRSPERMDGSAGKGGAKPSGKSGSPMTDSLYASEEAPRARDAQGDKPGTFELRLTGEAASAPADFEPQNESARGWGTRQAPQHEMADQQVEDDPLQKAQISPEHESLLRRIFKRD